MDQIGNKEVNSGEERSPHSSSPTHLRSNFDSKSAASSAQASSSSVIGWRSEVRGMDGANPTGDESINEEISEADLLLQKIQVPKILGRIFGMLDKRSLRSARAVSNKWNETALEILSKTPGRMNFIVEKDEIGEKGLGRIRRLHSILNVTKHPQMFFTRLALKPVITLIDKDSFFSSYVADESVLGPEKVQLLALLQNFGSNLKSLEFHKTSLPLSILRPLFENWCVNLEEVTFTDIKVIEDSNTSVQSFETVPSPLKLKLQKIRINDKYDCSAGPARSLIVSVIKCSPNLRAFQGLTLFEEADFWGKVASLPSITKNLEKVQIGTLYLKDLSWLKDISFSNKLKCLTLGLHEPSFPKEQLIEFLDKVAESLEEFSLHFYTVRWSDAHWKIHLPLMNNLKMLEHSGYFEILCFHSIDFLEMCPNLEILRLAASKDGDSIQAEEVDAFFLNSSYLMMHPHRKLKSLCLKGSPSRLETILVINFIFPNLNELSIHLDGEQRPESTDEKSWFIANFKEFSEMKNLNILKVYFEETFEWKRGRDLESCFSSLEASESLEELTIGRYCPCVNVAGVAVGEGHTPPRLSKVTPDFQDFPPGLEKVFVKIPKLKRLTFEGFQMGLAESRSLFEALNQRGILLCGMRSSKVCALCGK